MSSKAENTSPFRPSEIRASLETDGYVVLPSFIDDTQLAKLLHASRKLAALARAGEWPHLRTLPKQFPPWKQTPENGIWGVQHLLHPRLPLSAEEQDVFKEIYFGDQVIGVVKAVLGDEIVDCVDDMLVMELFNMLVTPEKNFALRWHRDDISFELSLEEEAAALGLMVPTTAGEEYKLQNGGENNGSSDCPADKTPSQNGQVQKHKKTKLYHTQYNIPLLQDRSLHLIPGSHRRPRTEDEVSKLAQDPYTDELDGWIEVQLQPGDVAFYDNSIIHRGVYSADKERLTLHGSVGDARAGSRRARNVLQHGCAWAGECTFDGLQAGIRRRAECMRVRLLELGSQQGDVGYSHQD